MAVVDGMSQDEVFEIALGVYDERNKKYQDLWKQYGAVGNLNHIQSKAARLLRGATAPKADGSTDLDDAYDLLNYVAFYIRNVEDGNWDGEQEFWGELWHNADGIYWWHIQSVNGRIVSQGEPDGYQNKGDAVDIFAKLHPGMELREI